MFGRAKLKAEIVRLQYNTYNELFWKVREKRGDDTGD